MKTQEQNHGTQVGDQNVMIIGGNHTIYLQGKTLKPPPFTSLPLSLLTPAQRNTLAQAAEAYHTAMKNSMAGLAPAPLQAITQALTQALAQLQAKEPVVTQLLHWVHRNSKGHTLVLTHHSNTLLNLPWHLAQVTIDGTTAALESFEHLSIAKALDVEGYTQWHQGEVLTPPDSSRYPSGRDQGILRVLVMVSSPQDDPNPLAYEAEERAILEAFEKLFGAQQVEITFTEDGSLQTLKEHLRQQPYHILHYSGHGAFAPPDSSNPDESENPQPIGWLALEDPITQNRTLCKGKDFAQALACRNDGHRIPLVVLATCQSAQGGEVIQQQGLSGVANQLLQRGTPAVVAMAHSVGDTAAAEYTAALYTHLSAINNLAPLPKAHTLALSHMKAQEAARLQKAGTMTTPHNHREGSHTPAQYHIPQLYLAQPVESLVTLAPKGQKAPSNTGKKSLVNAAQTFILRQDRSAGYQFIGRRAEKKTLMPALLLKGQPVMLLGQGGVGKTAMAEHLIERYAARYPNTRPFVLDEKTGGLPAFISTLKNFLTKNLRSFDHVDTLARLEGSSPHQGAAAPPQGQPAGEGAITVVMFLLATIKAKGHNPLIVLDNLESYQETPSPGAPFAPQYQAIAQWLYEELLAPSDNPYPLLLTGRYPLARMEGITHVNMNGVRFNDFWKKCSQLALAEAPQRLLFADHQASAPRYTLEELAKILYRTFGGHYRSLEFFDTAYAKDPRMLLPALQEAQAKHVPQEKPGIRFLEDALAQQKDRVLDNAAEDFAFGQLTAQLSDADKTVLHLLTHFQVPVTAAAVAMQYNAPPNTLPESLRHLHALTLTEQHADGAYHYAPPLIRELWKRQTHQPIEPTAPNNYQPFHHLPAAQYFDAELGESDSWELVESQLPAAQQAFAHYLHTPQHHRIADLGDRLAKWHKGQQLFREAVAYAKQAEEVLGFEGLSGSLMMEMGFNLIHLGAFEQALPYLEAAQAKIDDPRNRGTLLNNIGQIHKAKGDYDTALQFLKQALDIQQDIGDRAEEGTTLNNIGNIHQAKGDYDTALQFLKQALDITQDIGDRAGEGTILNNISQIHQAKGNYDTALKFLKQSLDIQQDIGDRAGEGTTLNNISQIHKAKGDYDTALHFLKQALDIQQEIGDSEGVCYTLHNMATIAHNKQDLETYMHYETQAWQLAQELRHGDLLYKIARDLGYVLCEQGNAQEGLPLLQQAFAIGKQMGDPDLHVVEELISKYSGGGSND